METTETKKLSLGVMDRLILGMILGSLTEKAPVTDWRIVQEWMLKLSFTEEEHQELDLKTDKETGTIQWNNAKEVNKDYEFQPRITKIIASELKRIQDNEIPIPRIWMRVFPLFDIKPEGLDDTTA